MRYSNFCLHLSHLLLIFQEILNWHAEVIGQDFELPHVVFLLSILYNVSISNYA
nr:MAG TPA: hypothetical protein [Caudoviricetes sp.]